MTLFARKSFVWLWMFALLSATFGLTVQRVYCYCTGKTTVSIFAAEPHCKQEEQAQAAALCCLKKDKPAPPACCKKHTGQKKGCTQKSTTFVQLHTEFEVVNADFKKLDAPKYWVPEHGPIAPVAPLLAIQKTERQGFDRPPPRLSGRMICVRHGVFRC